MSAMHAPPLRSYQRSGRAAAASKKPAATFEHESEGHSALSPLAQLHRTVLEKHQQQAYWEEESKEGATVAAAVPTFAPTIAAFPLLAPPAPNCCAVHSPAARQQQQLQATLPLAHPNARPSAVSEACPLPRASYWNLRCSCLFSAIPDELLLFNVFTFLPAAELCTLTAVCSRWKFLSTDPMLWREVDLSRHAKVVSPDVLDSVLARTGCQLRTLKLCNLKQLTTDSLQRVGEVHLATNSNLQSLHFCSLRAVDFSVLSALLAGSVASSLRELSLFGCVNVDDACVQLVRRHCVRLADLSVRGCLKITDAAFAPEVEVVVSDAKSEMTIEVLSESDLETEVLSRSTSFSSVTSSSSASSSSSELGRFAHLTALNVANCKLLTDAGLAFIARSSPMLQTLNAHGLNPTDAMVDLLTASCPNLHTLHLSSANPFGGNLQLTDRAIEFIAARLPNMQCLNLQGSSRLTDACIAPLIARCRRLSKLNLGGCHKLTDAGVMALVSADSVSQLTHVSLFQCVHLTDAALQHIADHLVHLQHLDIHSCASLTDATIAHLLELQTSAVAQDVREEEEIGSLMSPPSPRPVAARRSLTYRLPQLQSLDVGSCRKIQADIITRMRTIRTAVTVTHY